MDRLSTRERIGNAVVNGLQVNSAAYNRLYVRLLLAERQPDLSDALRFGMGTPCPVCGGILLHLTRVSM